MYLDFSALYHQSSKDRFGSGQVNIPEDPEEWPSEWKTLYYKEYPRLEKRSLVVDVPMSELLDTITKRSSRRDFSSRAITLKDISTILKYSCGIVSDEPNPYHRAQPSGGGRYPIEVYLFMFSKSELAPGIYHYDVRRHALDVLEERSFVRDDIASLFTYPWAQDASFAITFTGVFERNQMKYGERGYRHILIEAGAIMQNVYLIATQLGIKCCAIDGVNELPIESLLDIDGFAESALCSMVLG